MAVFSVEGVSEEPQTLREKIEDKKITSVTTWKCDINEFTFSHITVTHSNLNLKTQLKTCSVMVADLGSELPLPISGDLGAGADLLVGLGGLRRLTQLLGDTGQQGLLAREQGRLQFFPQQEVMFGLLHLRGNISCLY